MPCHCHDRDKESTRQLVAGEKVGILIRLSDYDTEEVGMWCGVYCFLSVVHVCQ